MRSMKILQHPLCLLRQQEFIGRRIGVRRRAQRRERVRAGKRTLQTTLDGRHAIQQPDNGCPKSRRGARVSRQTLQQRNSPVHGREPQRRLATKSEQPLMRRRRPLCGR